MTRRDFKTLGAFLLLVVGGGLAIGWTFAPGEWYARLLKPGFNPPNWVFGPVWTVLYVLIAVAGWRLWNHARSSFAMKMWWAQLILNFAWTPVFFGLRNIEAALVVILLMLAAILGCLAASWRTDRAAAFCFMPYALWVGYAMVLNTALAVMN